MKQRFGALLCLALGTVLIVTGLNGTSSGNVGATVADCGVGTIGGFVPCPTGTITFTETTTGTTSPPATWTVHITSTCLDPATGLAVDQTVNVPDGGSASSTALELYTTTSHGATCSYAFIEENIPPGDTVTFDPASPQTIPDDTTPSDSNLPVALTNVFTATTSSSTTSVPTSSSATSSSAATSVATSSSSASGALSNTGPRETVRTSLWIGIALCVLGVALLLGGRTRGRPRHSR